MSGARMRRIVGWGVSAGLTASLCVFSPPAAVAEVGAGPAADAAADWLELQLVDGLLQQDGGPDIGLTMDAVFSMQNVGGHDAAVAEMKAAIEANIEDYIDGTINNDANAVAKAAAYAGRIGEDPTDFGSEHVDLIDALEDRMTNAPGTDLNGRLEGLPGNPVGGVLANTIGQAFAVEALHQMDKNSLRSQGALEFLAKQQCDAATKGYFRPEFTPVGSSSPDQACDNAVVESEQLSDTETTATVLMMFYRLEEEFLVPLSAKGNAWTWLRNTQGRQVGSWSRTGDTSTIKNSKSTSLAGVAVSRDSVPSAALAALWIRGFQAFSPSPCATHLTDEGGAVAFEKVDFLDGELEGITPAQIDDWVDTTVYAADLLRFEDSAASVPALSGPTDYVEARKGVTLTIKNLDIGERICASGPSGNPRLISAKTTSTSLKLYTPIGTGRRTFQVVGMQGSDTHTVYALDKTTLKLKIAKYYVKRGAKQKIKVSGLAPGERVTVKVKGSKLMRGVASASGKFQKKFKVKAKRGKVKIVVTGQFATRTNRIPFKVL